MVFPQPAAEPPHPGLFLATGPDDPTSPDPLALPTLLTTGSPVMPTLPTGLPLQYELYTRVRPEAICLAML